jgi:iron complex transport system ATP-binding protein
MSLKAHSLTLGFPGRTLCRGLSFEVRPGEAWAVLGNNGSGKTTLLHCLAGIHRPRSGEVRLDEVSLPAQSATARARRVALLLQEEPIEFWGSVLDYVCLGRYPHRRTWFGWDAQAQRMAHEQLLRMDLAGLAGRALSSLSGGERQRVRLALVLTQDPAYYVLDEPLQHLDLRHQMQVLECFAGLARSHGKAVVMVLHDPRLARTQCDHALLLYDGGSFLAGEANRVLSGENLQRLYGVAVPL